MRVLLLDTNTLSNILKESACGGSPSYNEYQTAKMKSHGIFREINTEVGQIIVAVVGEDSTGSPKPGLFLSRIEPVLKRKSIHFLEKCTERPSRR